MKCIPPINWVQDRTIRGGDPEDSWKQLSFRPILYLCTWVSALVILMFGDFTSFPPETRDNAADWLFWVWGGLSLGAPIMGLVAIRLIFSPHGASKYRGMWLRFGADCTQFIAILAYTVMRFTVGDYHIYTMGVLAAVLLYVFHLVMMGGQQLLGVEILAARLQEDKDANG